MHIYAKIVCALVNRFIKIISQGKSLLIRETLQWKYIYAKIVCAIHQNYLSLKNFIDIPNFASAFNGRIDEAFMHFVAQKIWIEN